MRWKVKIAERASKEMKRIPKKDAKRLLFVLGRLTESPYQGDIEKVKGILMFFKFAEEPLLPIVREDELNE